MGWLPMLWRTEGKAFLVVGGGAVAARKTRWLLEAGARVTVVAPAVGEAMEALADAGRIALRREAYAGGDLSPYAAVFAATDEGAVNARVAADAARAGVPVNVADDPARCDFLVPATVRRGDFVVAAGTGGRTPSLAAAAREAIEALFPPWYADLAEALGHVRAWLRERCPDERRRRAILRSLADSAKRGSLAALDAEAMEARLREDAARLLAEDPGE